MGELRRVGKKVYYKKVFYTKQRGDGMFRESSFKETYKNAYSHIFPGESSTEKILARAAEDIKCQSQRRSIREKNQGQRAGLFVTRLRPVMAALLFVCILFVASIPVLAAHIPAVYCMLEQFVPDLADYIIPETQECADQGIIMCVEGVRLEGNRGEAIVSFANQEGYHRIKGKIDLYDSYSLVSYAAMDVMSGCHFLTYDEKEEKAYFKIAVTADNDFNREKLSFRVRELLTRLGEEEKEIDLSGLLRDVPVKEVKVSGAGGMFVDAELETGITREFAQVMNISTSENCAADDFTVIGAAYMDGSLRVQICMGDNTHADRHVRLLLTDGAGEERHADGSLSWFEDAGETRYMFYEYYFLITEEELQKAKLQGTFYDAGESVRGDWKVTFRLE